MLRGKQKEKRQKFKTPEYKILLFFSIGGNNKSQQSVEKVKFSEDFF